VDTTTVTLKNETPTLSAEDTESTISDLSNANDVLSVEEVEIKKPTAALMMTALFANNSSKLDSKTQKAIKAMVVKLKKMKIATLTVAGYSSAAAGVDNLKLSLARAKTLAALLVANGIKTKIAIKGLGIIQSSGSSSAIALTRKAEIWVLLKPQEANDVITTE